MSGKALIIVDVQKGFVNEQTKHIPALVEKLQYAYEHVFVTRFINRPNSLYRQLIHWNQLSPGTEETELAFTPRPEAVIIDKYIYTCIDDAFVERLKAQGIQSVDVCGIETDICVTKCAVDLFERGIVPFVLKDYCGTHASKAVEKAALSILQRYIGRSQVI